MTKLWTWVFISVGAILILLSIIGHVYQSHPLVTTGLETIGVTLASVFSIKLIYEKLIAQEHFGQFHNLLKTELANFRKNPGHGGARVLSVSRSKGYSPSSY